MPLTVLHLTPYLAPAWAFGEVPRSVWRLAQTQAEHGLNVTVLTSDARAPHERLPSGVAEVDGVRVVRVKNASAELRSWLGISTPVGFRRAARDVLASLRPDVVHLHEVWTVENWRIAPLVSPHTPMLLSTHGVCGPPRATLAWRARAAMFSRMFERLVHVVASSPADASQTREVFAAAGASLRADQFSVMPHGIEREPSMHAPKRSVAKQQLGLEDVPVVLVSGPIAGQACGDTILRACEGLRQHVSRLQFVYADSTHGRDQAADALARIETHARVRCVGPLRGADALVALAAADACVLPNLSSVPRQTVMNALLMNRPILTGKDDDAGVAASGAALVVNNSVSAWTDALLGLLRHPGTAQRMQARGQELAARQSWPGVATSVRELYEHLLGPPPV